VRLGTGPKGLNLDNTQGEEEVVSLDINQIQEHFRKKH
jgi:hypothetical protein